MYPSSASRPGPRRTRGSFRALWPHLWRRGSTLDRGGRISARLRSVFVSSWCIKEKISAQRFLGQRLCAVDDEKKREREEEIARAHHYSCLPGKAAAHHHNLARRTTTTRANIKQRNKNSNEKKTTSRRIVLSPPNCSRSTLSTRASRTQTTQTSFFPRRHF